MRNKELLEKFIKDNFDIKNFNIIWEEDWLVKLIDKNDNELTLSSIIPFEIFTMINNVKHLKYALKENYGTTEWVVVND